MTALKIILAILFILAGLALTVIVLMQEGKQQGLGAISGAADTYWGKNKGRSMEGILVKITTGLVVVFLVISLLLNIPALSL
ncbi:MAG: preprotein translocase subunit SecG [Lachnospiraceae bacterium]|nr:preprotein translocase subunit SecG [Lachnospiraceae bacterium]MBR0434499.1 preprotein translocase subunit SecG [Lachnospiraceae bacterium]